MELDVSGLLIAMLAVVFAILTALIVQSFAFHQLTRIARVRTPRLLTRGCSALVDLTNDEVTSQELSDENLVKIVNLIATDEECNRLAWKCLGYRYNDTDKSYNNDKVFPKWKAKFPQPPDLIGVTRNYSTEIDKPVRDASMMLGRSIRRDFKGGVKSLEKVGFKLYKLNELTPNKTRRAQLVNWLIYYREELYGKTLEELMSVKKPDQSQETPTLPSEKWFEMTRLDQPVHDKDYFQDQ